MWDRLLVLHGRVRGMSVSLQKSVVLPDRVLLHCHGGTPSSSAFTWRLRTPADRLLQLVDQRVQVFALRGDDREIALTYRYE